LRTLRPPRMVSSLACSSSAWSGRTPRSGRSWRMPRAAAAPLGPHLAAGVGHAAPRSLTVVPGWVIEHPPAGDSDLDGLGLPDKEPTDWPPASGAHRCPVLARRWINRAKCASRPVRMTHRRRSARGRQEKSYTLSASSLAGRRRSAPCPHRLLWWSVSQSLHHALLHPPRPHSTECLPNLSCLDPTGRSERTMGSYFLNSPRVPCWTPV
jgi:hypothetical protein